MATMTESMDLNEVEGEGLKVVVSRVIRAKRERVFTAWTNPAEMQRWFGPEGATCPFAEADLRVGGAYRIDVLMGGTDNPSSATGTYQAIVPNALLQFTWVGSWRPDEVTLVTVELQDVKGGTEVKITHELVGADGMAGYEKGWTGSLAKLEQVYGE